ncbi:MAG: transglycosylase SLT domain-containing protein [Fulvimonas sp.]|nr:transglycosylase SLT domain-containing protein [Fulvimonas sp.]
MSLQSARLALRPSPAAKIGWPLRLVLGLGLVLLTGVAQAADAATAAQREAFRQAWAAAQQGGEGWRAWDAQLAGYPLYPYLEAAALSHDLRQLDRARVEDYLRRYPDAIPAADLRRDFLLELARRQDWDGFLALYRPGLGDALACHALRARLARGGTLDFDRDLAALWEKPALPDACDDVLAAAHAQGLLTTTRLWARIDTALAAGQGGTVAALAAWLPADQAPAAQHLALALRDPANAVRDAATWPDAPRERQAAALAVQRLARRRPADAAAAWQALQPRLRFDAAEIAAIEYALALYQATDFDERALERLAALPAAAQTPLSRAWRARVALARLDWPAVLAAIAAMPAEQQDDAEWRYFRARAAEALGQSAQARTLYAALAAEPGYFGFLAADQLGMGYALCPLEPPHDPAREQALANDPGLVRAFELYAVGLPRLARREWARALEGADADTLALAAELAFRQGWYDRAIYVFSHGPGLRYYDRRFPLAEEDGLPAQADQAGIEPAFAYAIARAESAWTVDARSGADARGLMQLLPTTAAQVARRHGLDWQGGDSLYDPAVNVALGTRYLAELAGRFGGAPWLTAAAYNAGPDKVQQWLDARGALPPDVFIATIPYAETREYVARVLAFSVIYDWRLHGAPLPMSARLQPPGQATPAAMRRPVSCAAVPAPAELETR